MCLLFTKQGICLFFTIWKILFKTLSFRFVIISLALTGLLNWIHAVLPRSPAYSGSMKMGADEQGLDMFPRPLCSWLLMQVSTAHSSTTGTKINGEQHTLLLGQLPFPIWNRSFLTWDIIYFHCKPYWYHHLHWKPFYIRNPDMFEWQ